MEITPTEIPDVLLIKPRVFNDERGFFMETYQKKKMQDVGISYDFVQENHPALRAALCAVCIIR